MVNIYVYVLKVHIYICQKQPEYISNIKTIASEPKMNCDLKIFHNNQTKCLETVRP